RKKGPPPRARLWPPASQDMWGSSTGSVDSTAPEPSTQALGKGPQGTPQQEVERASVQRRASPRRPHAQGCEKGAGSATAGRTSDSSCVSGVHRSQASVASTEIRKLNGAA